MKQKLIHFSIALIFYGLSAYVTVNFFDKENSNPWFYIILWSVSMGLVDVFIFAKMRYALRNARKTIDTDDV
ncbi:MAG: hypothetical protein ACK4UK_09345 [Flavobacterium sp.]